MKNLVLALTITTILSAVCNGQETMKPNPSDMTQVNTFAYGQLDGDDVRGMIGFSGAYSEGNTFMGLVEHSINTRSKEHNTRLRYFQVLDTQSIFAPQAGVSVDYMKNYSANSDVAAIGIISKVLTPFDALTIYPNVAYVTGKIDNQNINGYQTNLFASLALGDSGDYIVLQPQYMDTNSGKEFKIKTGYGSPIDSLRNIWFDVGHEYQQRKPIFENKKSDEHKFSMGISYYF